MVGVGTATGKEEVDQGQGGGYKVRLAVAVYVISRTSGLSANTIGSSAKLGNSVVEVSLTLVAVMFQFHHGIWVVLISGIAKVVVCTVRVTVVVTVGCPEMVTVLVVVQATSIGVTKDSIENVVVEVKVEGATMIFSGPTPVTMLEPDLESATDAAT
jgi:hypothetical protein